MKKAMVAKVEETVEVIDRMKINMRQFMFVWSLFIVTIEADTIVKYVTIPMMDGLHCIVPTETEVDSSIPGLSQELVNTLSYMGNEERLAYDVYNALYTQWGTRQFTDIANNSEIKHIQAVQDLIQKYKINDDVNFTNVDLPALGYMNTDVEQMQAGTYDISEIQRLYDDLVSEGSASEVAALQAACKIEVIDVEDLDAYIEIAEVSNAQDIVDTFNFLRNGSYSHYWTFDGALKNIGISDGCCSLGTAYCHPEYPQNEKGNGGNGNGNGNGGNGR